MLCTPRVQASASRQGRSRRPARGPVGARPGRGGAAGRPRGDPGHRPLVPRSRRPAAPQGAAPRRGDLYSAQRGPPAPSGGGGAGLFDVARHMHGLRSFTVEARRALRVPLGNVEVPVLPLERIIASKRATNRPKDRAILPVLEDALAASRGPAAGTAYCSVSMIIVLKTDGEHPRRESAFGWSERRQMACDQRACRGQRARPLAPRTSSPTRTPFLLCLGSPPWTPPSEAPLQIMSPRGLAVAKRCERARRKAAPGLRMGVSWPRRQRTRSIPTSPRTPR